jgi:hypothetical protein
MYKPEVIRIQFAMIPELPPMTDYDGTCSLSVDDAFLNEAVKVYPNPSNGEFL